MNADWLPGVPKIIGCQTIGANSLVRAFKKNAETITRLKSIKTVAASLAEFASGHQALRAVRESGGEALEVTDKETLGSMRWMSQRGIALEPSSAASRWPACAEHVPQKARVKTAVRYGSPLARAPAPKWPEDLLRGFTMPPVQPDGQSFCR